MDTHLGEGETRLCLVEPADLALVHCVSATAAAGVVWTACFEASCGKGSLLVAADTL